jgi:hypothetical protein
MDVVKPKQHKNKQKSMFIHPEKERFITKRLTCNCSVQPPHTIQLLTNRRGGKMPTRGYYTVALHGISSAESSGGQYENFRPANIVLPRAKT